MSPQIQNKTQSNWHCLPLPRVFSQLKAGRFGLTEEEAEKRLKRYGPNLIPEPKPVGALRLFLAQLKSPLFYILLLAGVITLVIQQFLDTMIIWAALVLNVGIGFFQERKASKALQALKKLVQKKARVIRAGHYKEIERSQIVPGDIILLDPGDKVPADGRVFESDNLEVREEILTGEWEPAQKRVAKLGKKVILADRENMVYQGTAVAAGSGRAIIVATGEETEFGRIALSLEEQGEEVSPLQRNIASLTRILGLIFVLVACFIAFFGLWRGLAFYEVITIGVALAVSVVPEGLPTAITVILALGMERILKKKGLVRRLAAAETLGRTSVICADKTGTLTQAKMAVAKVVAANKKQALEIGRLAAEVFVENPEASPDEWIIRATPTDKALFFGAIEKGIDPGFKEKSYPLVKKLPFDADEKYLAKLRHFDQKHYMLYVSGAPESILKRSERLAGKKGNVSLSQDKRKALEKALKRYARLGLRMVGVASRKITVPPTKRQARQFLEQHLGASCQKLIFAGFIALSDPLRQDAAQTIQSCKHAGLRPIMITGDHKETARMIARQLKLPHQRDNILDGHDLDKMKDSDLQNSLQKIAIYARVTPKHKLRIVKAWQKQGEVVAMTGDGVNDAPALVAADIGVALGSGTDVAREAADMVLMKDNFSVIVAAIREGRSILDNIRKVIVYLLSDVFDEVLLIGGSFLLGLPLPILPVQILWLNLVEDGLPDMALAFERPEVDVMRRKPIQAKRLLNREMKILIFTIGIWTDILLFALYWILLRFFELDLVHIRTIIFAALTFDSLLYVYSCRSLRRPLWRLNPLQNKYLFWATILSMILLILAVYLPPLQRILNTVSLAWWVWLVILADGLVDLFAIELTKYFLIIRKKKRGQSF